MAALSNWQRIREAFERCLELPESEREPFLNITFNGDDSSRREVIQLLEGDREAVSSNFLDWEVNDEFDKQNSLKPGDRIGDYLVIRRVGAGGSGVVYKVRSREDESKIFAVKILHSWRNNEEGVRRFQREIEVLRQFNHASIAQCLEYGTDDGVLFLVMPFIDGDELDQYLRHHEIPIRRRVELFHKICQAVAHAHEHLILHRDLKPANIMIDRDGNPVVMDFGLAKLVGEPTESLNLTTTGRIIGTPSFMAPEQTGDGTPPAMTTDVYGLGAVLYFLLTDQPPFGGHNLFEIGHAIRTIRPQDPRSINTSINRELAPICLKCLEKAPEDRYPTVSALAEDITRYLDGRPVSAKPRSSAQQLLDWVRNNRWVSVLSATLLLFLITGLLLTLYFWQNSNAQASLLLKLVQQQVSEMKKSIDDPTSLSSRANELRFITETFEDFEQLAILDEATRDSAAQCWFLLGRAENYLGNRDAAVVAFQGALDRFQSLSEDYPESLDYEFDVFHCLNSLYRHAEALIQAQLVVAKDGGKNPDYLAALGAALFAQASRDLDQGNFESAQNVATSGVEFANQHFGPRDGVSPERRRIASFEWLLARLKLLSGELENAIKLSSDSIALQQGLIAEYPTNEGLRRELLSNLDLQFQVYFQLNDRNNSEKCLVLLESTSTQYFDLFPDYNHTWQARDLAFRLRWFFECEYGTPDSADFAAQRLDDFLVEWSVRFPQRYHAKLYRAWLLAHPENKKGDSNQAQQLLTEVGVLDSSGVPVIRAKMALLTALRLDPALIHEEILDYLPENEKQFREVLPRYWKLY